MTMSDIPVTAEVSNHKVAAVFPDASVAQQAAAAVASSLALAGSQVQLIRPGDPHPGRKLEPESRGIWQTIIVAHVKLGIAGVIGGAVLFGVLYAMGVPFIVNSAIAALLVIMFFGGVAGLMLGGLVSLRPDHDRYVEATREAVKEGMTTVVVHAYSVEQRSQAAEFLQARGGNVTSTL
jgi:hypothetical protein